MSGRPRKPTKVLILEGNRGKCLDRLDLSREPQPATGEPVMPAWMGPAGRVKWAELVRELRAIDLLTGMDQALIGYCAAWDVLANARWAINREGRFTAVRELDGQGKPYVVKRVKHPACGEEKDALMLLRGYGADLGLSPSARTRIKVEPKAEVDPMDKFFKAKEKA